MAQTKKSQDQEMVVFTRTFPGDEGWEPFQTRSVDERAPAPFQSLPAPVSGASQAYHPALEDEGSEPLQTRGH